MFINNYKFVYKINKYYDFKNISDIYKIKNFILSRNYNINIKISEIIVF